MQYNLQNLKLYTFNLTCFMGRIAHSAGSAGHVVQE